MARSIAVVTDSTSDLPRSLAALRGIEVIPLTVNIDGRDYQDGVEIEPDTFYPLLQASRTTPTTSQPSPASFAQAYERLLRDHDEVVSIHISSKLSGTYASARHGADLVDGERVRLVDSGLASMPLALVVLVASQMAADGADWPSISRTLEEVRVQMRTYFTLSTLEYLRRGGRIGRAGALLGSLLQVKPVLTLEDGEVGPLERVRTYERALARVGELSSAVDTGRGVCAMVGHASTPEAAERLGSALAPRAESLLIQPMGPVVGTHAGPGAVGVACYPAELFPLRLGTEVSAAGAL